MMNREAEEQQQKEASDPSSSAEALASEAGSLASPAMDPNNRSCNGRSRSPYVDDATGSIRDGTSLDVAQYFKTDIPASARFFCLDIGNGFGIPRLLFTVLSIPVFSKSSD